MKFYSLSLSMPYLKGSLSRPALQRQDYRFHTGRPSVEGDLWEPVKDDGSHRAVGSGISSVEQPLYFRVLREP